jgi:hypothetical protein
MLRGGEKVVSAAAGGHGSSKRRMQRKPPPSASARSRGDGILPLTAWQRILVEVADSPRALVVLGMVNRELHQTIWSNHSLMRALFFRHWYWDPKAHTLLRGLLHIEGETMQRHYFTPLRRWETEGVPLEQRTRFNAYVHRMCVLRFAPWCSLCHRFAPENSTRHHVSWVSVRV